VSPAFIALGVTVVVVAVAGTVVALTDDGPTRGTRRRPLPVPAPWIAIGAFLLVMGVLVMPKLLGFTFLFLPMIWSRRARRPRGPSGPAHDRDRDPYDEDR